MKLQILTGDYKSGDGLVQNTSNLQISEKFSNSYEDIFSNGDNQTKIKDFLEKIEKLKKPQITKDTMNTLNNIISKINSKNDNYERLINIGKLIAYKENIEVTI